MGAENVVTVERPVVAEMAEQDGDRGVKLMMRAQEGDKKALAELRRQFEGKPKFWQEVGEYGRYIESHLVQQQTRGNLLLAGGLTRKLEGMRTELAGPDPTPLERLLANRVAMCWLQLQIADAQYNREGIMLTKADYEHRMIDRAHNRYLSAIHALATVRKLQLPAVQVNIGEKQVNIGS